MQLGLPSAGRLAPGAVGGHGERSGIVGPDRWGQWRLSRGVKCGRWPVPMGAGGSGSWMRMNRRSVDGSRRQRSMRAATWVLLVMEAGTRLASNSVPLTRCSRFATERGVGVVHVVEPTLVEVSVDGPDYVGEPDARGVVVEDGVLEQGGDVVVDGGVARWEDDVGEEELNGHVHPRLARLRRVAQTASSWSSSVSKGPLARAWGRLYESVATRIRLLWG